MPVIGFIAHVDTSPEMQGHDVHPIVHSAYDGRDLVLPDDPAAVLRAADDPSLAAHIGHDIVTASGHTLLGADDKAGVAEIVAAAEYLMAHPEIPHGAVRVAFTPDEEIGRGANHFDVGRFGALCAYTMDGGNAGELEWESFSADAMTDHVQGIQHAPRLREGPDGQRDQARGATSSRACRKDRLSPETTDDHDGYVHPYMMEASVDRTSVKLLVRDFSTSGPGREGGVCRGTGACRRRRSSVRPGVEIRIGESYRNMKRHSGGISRGRRVRARSDPPQRADASRATHPRRHGWVTTVVHGPADAEHLRRRAQLPLPARMGLGAGHGQGGRDDRQPVSGLGREDGWS